MGCMTNGFTFNTLRQANEKRLATTEKFKKTRDWTPSQWFAAMIGEAGEYANLIKKVERGDLTLEAALPELGKELADVMTYLDLLAAKVGVDLGKATEAKFNEVSDRVGSPVYIDGDDWHLREQA